jgi:hypothetical protein
LTRLAPICLLMRSLGYSAYKTCDCAVPLPQCSACCALHYGGLHENIVGSIKACCMACMSMCL